MPWLDYRIRISIQIQEYGRSRRQEYNMVKL